MKKVSIVIGVTILLFVLYCVAGTLLFFLDEPLQNMFYQDSGLCRCGTVRHTPVPVADWEIQFLDAIILSLCGAVIVARYGWWNNQVFRHVGFWYTIYILVSIGIMLIDWRFRWVPYTQVYSVERCLCLVIYLVIFSGIVAIVRRCRSKRHTTSTT